jgi:hypothetical protein
MSTPRHRCRLRVFADYHQFYVWDLVTSDRHAPENWSDKDVADRAKVMPGVVVICAARNIEVSVQVGVWDSEPQVIFDAWQHVIEAPLTTAGQIEIHECTGGSQAVFSVAPGDYTVRELYRDLDTLSEDGLEGHDFYEVQIWQSHCDSIRVIRRWE